MLSLSLCGWPGKVKIKMEKSKKGTKNDLMRRGVPVHLHGLERPFYVEELEGEILTVEDIILRIVKEKLPCVGPASFNTFGCAVINMKAKKKCLWKNLRTPLTVIAEELKCQDCKFFLRIRYLPSQSHMSYFRILGSDMVMYLCCQIVDDFREERLKEIYKSDISHAKARGIAVLSYLIYSKLAEKRHEPFDFKCVDFLPVCERPSLMKRWKLENNMKNTLEEYNGTFQNTPIEDFMLGLIKDVLEHSKHYRIEKYMCEIPKQEGNILAEVLIDVYNQPSGLFVKENNEEQHFSSISNLLCINVRPVHSGDAKGFYVHIDRTTGAPKTLIFEEESLMESFVSCLVGYYRIMVNYHFSLWKQAEPLFLDNLLKRKCHGPVGEVCAEQKLRQKQNEPELYFIVIQDDFKFNEYQLCYLLKNEVKKETIKFQNSAWFSSNFSKEFTCLQHILDEVIEREKDQVFLGQSRRGIPTSNRETCHLLKRIFEDDTVLEHNEGIEPVPNKIKIPHVILPEDIENYSRFYGVSKFELTEVSTGHYVAERQLVAIKSVRNVKDVKMQQALEFSVAQQIRFQTGTPFFVKVIGLILTQPPRSMLEYCPLGSLSRFFSFRKPDQPLYFIHFLKIITQVADALYSLEERDLSHGNLCCSNILVHHFDFREINIKIGDVGMLGYYQSLKIDDDFNRNRLPWIAPECFTDLKQVNKNTDVYAFGTTVWEVFAQGANPLDCPPLDKLKNEMRKIYFLEGRELPECQGLRIQETDLLEQDTEKLNSINRNESAQGYIKKTKSEIKNLLTKCRAREESMRPSAQSIVRDLNNLTCDFSSTENGYVYAMDEIFFRYNPEDELEEECLEAKMPHEPIQGSVVNMPLPPLPVPRPKKFELDSNCLFISDQVLGEGNYGKVFKGFLYKSPEDKDKKTDRRIPVAIKELCGAVRDILQKDEAQKEMSLMQTLSHANVVKFYGNSKTKIVMEYIENGSLHSFLLAKRKNIPCTLQESMKILLGIANGMKYLESESIVHTDLAARNVLMQQDLNAKVSDFGLARCIKDSDNNYYKRERNLDIPLMWCAPESLENFRYFSKSDVWSYAVVCWEVFSHGSTPNYSEKAGSKISVNDLITLLKSNKRLCKHRSCPDVMYEFMMECWNQDPFKRPDFSAIFNKLLEFNTPEKIASMESSHFKHFKLHSSKTKPEEERIPHIHQKYFLKEEDVRLIKGTMLGQGCFGIVQKGTFKLGDNWIDVAIKKLKNENSLMVREVEVLGSFDHINIVKFFGFCYAENFFVMELCERGSLISALKDKNSQISLENKQQIVIDIAEGMRYIAEEKRVIHGDLSARNILLDRDFHAKITDFGLAMVLKGKDYYRTHNDTFNVIWNPPECFEKDQPVFSTQSDIWSFACVLYEIFTNGQEPILKKYGINWKSYFDGLRKGERLEKPPQCPTVLYELMLNCWNIQPQERPSFSEICLRVKALNE